MGKLTQLINRLKKDDITVRELHRPKETQCIMLLEYKTGMFSAWMYYLSTGCEAYIHASVGEDFSAFKKTALKLADRMIA